MMLLRDKIGAALLIVAAAIVALAIVGMIVLICVEEGLL